MDLIKVDLVEAKTVITAHLRNIKVVSPFMPSQPIVPPNMSAVLAHQLTDDDLLLPLIDAPSDRPYVIAQLGQSLDGRIATPTGESRWINGKSALDHVHRMRSHVDAVIVGIGTVLADNPRLTVRRVPGRNPARVIIDPNGKLTPDVHCLADDGTRCIVVRGDDRPVIHGAETLVVEQNADGLAPRAIVQALFKRGLRKILVEGGASTVSRFIDDAVLDRLHILTAPVILGSGVTGLSLAPIAKLEHALRPPTRVHVLDDGDVVFDCDLSRKSEG